MDTTATTNARETRRGTGIPLAVAISLALASPLAQAEFEPEITVGLSHTDNVLLETVDEDSELIYRLEPSFRFTREDGPIDVNADYRLQALRYRDIGDTELYHQWDLSVRGALLPDTFFLEVGTHRRQTIVDPEQAIPFSSLPISSKRQDRSEYYAAPSFQYALGSNVAVNAEYRHSWVEYERSGAQSNRQGDARFSLDNYRKEHGLTWALRYDWHRTRYEQEQDVIWEYQRAMAELGFWVGGKTRLFAAAGKESAWDMPLDPKLEDDLWEAGFSNQLGEHLSAEFAAGERSFGASWRGNLQFTFSHGSTKLSYAETPTTEGRVRQWGGVFDAPDAPGDFLERPGDTERFIAKRLAWTLNVELRRTRLALSLFDVDRSERMQADGTPLADESQRGARMDASFDVGVRTTLRFGGSWAERDLQSGGTSDLMRAFAGADYRLGHLTTLALTYDYAEEDPEGVATVRDYVANVVSLDLTRSF